VAQVLLQFVGEYNSERILQIGQNLSKLSTNV